jgi:serine/threonine-protein kinase HipA
MAKPDSHRQNIEVHLDAADLGVQQRIGTMHRPLARTDLPASFEYDPEWLRSERAFMLDPRLELWTGEQHPPAKTAAFGIFMDSSPDRWGRVLMERREAAVASREQRPMQALQELDFLLGVQDLTRAGALRFRSVEGGDFLDDSDPSVPPVTSLRELASISARLEEPDAEKLPEYERWLALLIAPGTSLGGARPKANFTDEGRLWIAKFPARDDRYDVGAWEYVVHRLALDSGLVVPECRLESLTDRYRTFCTVRFDRGSGSRRMSASAMTLLERRDGDQDGSYLDLAEFISDQGATTRIAEDLEQLYRRVAFNVVVGNRDDHLRNHAFIREPSGWRLSPAYDINPSPFKVEHTLTLDGANAAPDLATVLSTAELYRLERSQAQGIVEQVKATVSKWQAEALRISCPREEITRMRDVFQV